MKHVKLKLLPLVLLLLLFSCQTKNTKQTKVIPQKIEQGIRAENDLEISLTDILEDSIRWEKQLHKTGVYTDHFSLAWTKTTDKKSKMDTSNAYYFQGQCYTTIYPHSEILKREEKQISEEDRFIENDDKMYYNSLAFETLDSCKIPSKNYHRDKRYLIFTGKNGVKFILDSKKMLHAWGIILFNGKDVPTFWFGTDISKTIKLVY